MFVNVLSLDTFVLQESILERHRLGLRSRQETGHLKEGHVVFDLV